MNDSLTYFTRGNEWAAKKGYERAIAEYSEAIRLDPNLAVAYVNRGHCSFAKEESEGAIADYNEAIRLDPRLGTLCNGPLARAYAKRANACYARGELHEAPSLPTMMPSDATPV